MAVTARTAGPKTGWSAVTTAPRSPQPEHPLELARTPLSVEPTAAGAGPLLPAPRALLLDFGGVVVTTAKRISWARELTQSLVRRARAAGLALDPALVESSLRTGRAALSLWKNAASRRLAPRELASAEILTDFLLSDLPAPARAALALDAQAILAEMAILVADHHVRPGVPELLATAREHGIPCAIVSNAHSGRAHRRILADAGLAEYFGVQIYSDEVGIRKPHPDMIRLATGALGVRPEEAWYVGDTLDRDVVAGRRADVGAVIITRDRRTDTPPFPITDRPDLVLETPEGLLDHLRAALDRADGSSAPQTAGGAAPGETAQTAAAPSAPARGSAPRHPALLLDHGGVITTSTPNPERDRVIGARIVEISRAIGHPIGQDTAEQAMREGWELFRAVKRSRDADAEPGRRHREIAPATLWGDLIGARLPGPLRAALRLEAPELSHLLHRIKNHPRPRAGALELIRWAHDHGIVVGIVSNTISGRGVRATLERYGIADLIGPAAYSEEIGVRKPGGEIFEAALAGLETDRADVLYVGDKALNDGRGAREAGIGTICLLRGGKDSDAALDAALAAGHADHILDRPDEVIDLLAARLDVPVPDAT